MSFLDRIFSVVDSSPGIKQKIANCTKVDEALTILEKHPKDILWILRHHEWPAREKERLVTHLSLFDVEGLRDEEFEQIKKMGSLLRNQETFRASRNTKVLLLEGSDYEELHANKVLLALQSPFLRVLMHKEAKNPSDPIPLQVIDYSRAAYESVIEYLHLSDRERETFFAGIEDPTFILEMLQLANYLEVDEVKSACDIALLEAFAQYDKEQICDYTEEELEVLREVARAHGASRLEEVVFESLMLKRGITCHYQEMFDPDTEETESYLTLILDELSGDELAILRKFPNLSFGCICGKEAAIAQQHEQTEWPFRWMQIGEEGEGTWDDFPVDRLAVLFKSMPNLEMLSIHADLLLGKNEMLVLGNDPRFLKSLSVLNRKVRFLWDTEQRYGQSVPVTLVQRFVEAFSSDCAGQLLPPLKKLVDAGLALDYRDYFGNGPLQHCKDLQLLEFLLEEGIDPREKNVNGNTPMHFACRREPALALELLKRFAHYGGEVNAENHVGYNALHTFIREKGLLKKGADAVLKWFLDGGVHLMNRANTENALQHVCRWGPAGILSGALKEQVQRMVNEETLSTLTAEEHARLQRKGPCLH